MTATPRTTPSKSKKTMKKSWIHYLQNEEVSFDHLLYASPGFEDNKAMKKVKITLPLQHNIYRILFATI